MCFKYSLLVIPLFQNSYYYYQFENVQCIGANEINL